MAATTPLPTRLETEPPLWYRRFIAWLQSGPPRSLLGVYNEEREAKGQNRSDSHPASWREIPTTYQWASRAAEYDKAEAERKSVELAERREAWRKTEETMAAALVNKGREIIDGIMPKLGKDVNPLSPPQFNPSKVNAARACFDTASTLARRALEMADKYIDPKQLTDAEIMRLLGVAQQSAPADDSNTH